MKNLLLVLLLVIISSCGTTRIATRSYYNPYDNYYNYYNPYPYGFTYGFGLNYQYGPRYNDQHRFYGKPRLPKQEHRESPNKDKRGNKDYQPTYKRPDNNVRSRYNTQRPNSTPQPRQNNGVKNNRR